MKIHFISIFLAIFWTKLEFKVLSINDSSALIPIFSSWPVILAKEIQLWLTLFCFIIIKQGLFEVQFLLNFHNKPCFHSTPSFSPKTLEPRTSATLRKITDLRNFLHQYHAPLRTSVTLLKFVTELRNTPYGAT